jgi:arylsulfatase A-like enzyme
MPERNNLLFIMTDHQRADSLGMFQAGVEATPALNAMAKNGVVFERCYNTSPLCVPARTALATGLYPTFNGETFNDWESKRAGDFKPLHQMLAESGYTVGHVGIHHVKLKPKLEDRVAFEKFITAEDYARYREEAGLGPEYPEGRAPYLREITENQDGQEVRQRYSNTAVARFEEPLAQFKDAYYAREAEAFMRAEHQQPWALFVCLFSPHPPLRVPEPYHSMFDPAKLDLPANVGLPAKNEPPNRRRGMPAQMAEGISMEEWRRVWAAHLGLVRLADDVLGQLLATLDATGQAEQTLTVFASDHGDHLGQHCMYQKMEMYEAAVRVPLVFSGAGVTRSRSATPVSHLDIVPTLLDVLGTGTCTGTDLDGISLRTSLADGAEPPEHTVFSQYSGNYTLGDIRRAAITRRWKYVFDPQDAPELYDLESDPLEICNVAADPANAKVMAELHRELAEYHSARGDWVKY